jgi:hypothetical protein
MKTFDAEKSFEGRGSIANELSEIRQKAEEYILMSGVVVEYLSSPSNLTPDVLQRLVEMGASSEVLESAPPNSLAVIPTNNGQAHSMNKVIVCYPFFSHFALPVKPGEMVWFTTGKSETPTNDLFYWWLSRIVLPEHCEDNNYAHHDRKFWDREEVGYPNGPGGGSARTLPGGDDAFDQLIEESKTISLFVPSVSPRPVSNPNKSFVAGSHRNVINLDVYGESGFVEIVAGLPRPESRLSSRGWEEVDHAEVDVDPSGSTVNFTEAEARIIVSEDLEFAESLFGLDEFSWAEGFSGKETTTTRRGLVGLWSTDTVFAKGLNSVRLEGDDTLIHLQGGQLAVQTSDFLVRADRMVLLENESARLFIGGDDANEPFVLGAALQSWQESMIDVLNNILDALNSAIIPSPVGPLPLAGASTSTGTFSSDVVQAKQALQQLKTDIPKHLSKMANINGTSKAD